MFQVFSKFITFGKYLNSKHYQPLHGFVTFSSLIENSDECSVPFIKNNLFILDTHRNVICNKILVCNEESNFLRNAVEEMTNVSEFLPKQIGKGNKELEDGIVTLNEKQLICALNSFDGAFVLKFRNRMKVKTYVFGVTKVKKWYKTKTGHKVLCCLISTKCEHSLPEVINLINNLPKGLSDS